MTLPVLPQAFVDATAPQITGQTFPVPVGASLQTALDMAATADPTRTHQVVIDPGVRPVSPRVPFVLPPRPDGATGWVVIRSSQPLPERRIEPLDAGLLPVLEALGGGDPTPALVGGTGQADRPTAQTVPHHYWLRGLEFRPAPGHSPTALVQIGDLTFRDGQWVPWLEHPGLTPHHLVFDQVYAHGLPDVACRRGLALQGAHIAVLRSHVGDCKDQGVDTQAIWGYNGIGPYWIEDNYLEAAAECVMFGGSDNWGPIVPADITIRRNTFSKPLGWRGTGWTVKNLFELKNARRVLVEGNVFERCWEAAQGGFAVQLTPRNQDGNAPWSTVEDVTIRYNLFREVAGGFNCLAADANPSGRLSRVFIHDNLVLADRTFGNAAMFRPITHGSISILDLVIAHNTFWGTPATLAFTGDGPGRHEGFVLRDNICAMGDYGFAGTGTGDGDTTLARYYSLPLVRRNAFVGASSGNWQSQPENLFPASVSFVDAANGNYRLAAGDPLRGQATDGKDIGADLDALDASLVPAAIPTPTPLPQSGGDTTMPKTLNISGAIGNVPGGTYTVRVALMDGAGVVRAEGISDPITVATDPAPTPTAAKPVVTVV